MGEDDGGSVMMQGAGKQLARGNIDRSGCARCQTLEGDETVLLIEEKHAERFQPLPLELQQQKIAHIVRRRKRPRGMTHLFRHETPRQLRNGKNLRRFCLAEAAQRLQIGRTTVKEANQATARFQQILRKTQHIHALRTSAQQNRQQLIIGQRRRAFRQQALARHIR